MNERKISSFYRTSSPIGAAAQKARLEMVLFPLKLISTTSFLLKRVLLSLKVDSGIFDDFKHSLAIFKL